jgi:methyltransferase (TIGR00027 family)
MQKNKASKTAEVVAAVRAVHFIHDQPVIFADPYAIQLTSAFWKTIVSNRLLRWLMFDKALNLMRPVRGDILARARFAEDELERAMAAGIKQYVLIGAGLDSFALRRRDLEGQLAVYELDHSATQQLKREKLAQIAGALPKNLVFLAVNFEHRSVAQALVDSSYRPEQRAFFSWLGVTPYLTREATLETLRSLASFAAAGSEIVFNYLIPRERIPIEERAVTDAMYRFVARRGEPMIGEFDPQQLADELRNLGYEVLANLSPQESQSRYFQGRRDDLRAFAGTYFAHARVLGK